MSSVGITQQTFTTEASASKSINAASISTAGSKQDNLEREGASQTNISNSATSDSKQTAQNEPSADSTKNEAINAAKTAAQSDVNNTNGAQDPKQPSEPNSDLSTEAARSIEADTLKGESPQIKSSKDKEQQQASEPNNTTSDSNSASAESGLTNVVEQVVETIIEELNPFADDGSTVTTSNKVTMAGSPIEDPKSTKATDNRAVPTTTNDNTNKDNEATTPATFTEYPKPPTSADKTPVITTSEVVKATLSNDFSMNTPSTDKTLPVTSTEVNIQETSKEYPKPTTSVDEVSSTEVSTHAKFNEFSATTTSTNEASAVTSTEIPIPTSSTEQPMLTTFSNGSEAATNSTEFNMHSTSAEELSVTDKSPEENTSPPLSLLESKSARTEGAASRPLLPLRSSRRDRHKERLELKSRRLERDNTLLKERLVRINTSPGPYNRALLVRDYVCIGLTLNSSYKTWRTMYCTSFSLCKYSIFELSYKLI